MRKTIEQESLLLDALHSIHPEASRTTLRQMLQASRVRVNGEIEKNARRELRAGDVVDLGRRQHRFSLHPDLALLYEDDAIIVVVKAAGLLTVATPSETDNTAQAHLNAYLRSRRDGRRIHVVHRLDRDTSGVLVFTKTFEAKEQMKALFSRHEIDRLYVAVVEGFVEPPAGTFRSHLVENQLFRLRSTEEAERGKLAVTHYRTIRRGSRYSMLEVTLETGRKNQIRVHLSEAGHPIVGDEAYGSGVDPLGRLGLHARILGFVHPTTGKTMRFEAPVPDVFQNLEL